MRKTICKREEKSTVTKETPLWEEHQCNSSRDRESMNRQNHTIKLETIPERINRKISWQNEETDVENTNRHTQKHIENKKT